MPVKPIPEGYHTVTPYLIVADAGALIDFATRAFGAAEVHRSVTPDGRIMHADVLIGDSHVMVGEANEQWKPMPCMLHIYVEDVDAVYRKAVASGGTSLREPTDEFYGDRSAGVVDSQGMQWWIATHKEDVSPEEMERRMAAQKR